MLAVRLLRRAEVHGHAVLHHFVLLQDLIEDVQRPPAIDHEILGNNLEPVAHRLARKNEGQRCSPAPQQVRNVRLKLWLRGLLLFGRHLAAVSCAAALALARVLALATIVARLAAALALARVLALTSVLFLRCLVSLLLRVLSGSGSLPPGEQIGSLDAGASAREQARDRRTR